MQSRTTLPKATVLVVDDNDVVRRVLSGIIRHDQGLQLIGEAAHGEAAVDVARKKRPDVVCLDVMMPGMDGMSVLKLIRETAPNTKFIIISGYPTAELVGQARELGASGFVVKPFNAAKVLETIHAAVTPAAS